MDDKWAVYWHEILRVLKSPHIKIERKMVPKHRGSSNATLKIINMDEVTAYE